ncbi:DUF6118 family protein [Brucella intermedia]|uniref:DUF6118 family protein n=1 Tax=Brucella intermedia TaxID=94625 RepID=UPI0022490067|nr:DUF6118 family protein [Brucella intermedia]
MTELYDDKEGIEPEVLDENVSDPAAAFDALRQTIETQGAQIGAEMTVIRRGLEAAFDQFEKIEPQANYKPQLAHLVQALDTVAEHLNGVEQSPILRNGPEHYAARLERSGEGLVRTAVQQLERQASNLERAGQTLSEHVASARERSRQDWWIVGGLVFGVVLGVLATLFVPRILPGTVDMAVAATVMNNDRWKAGIALMQSGSSGGWRSIVEASDLVRANRETLSACADAAAKAKKDQKCSITVAVPAQ